MNKLKVYIALCLAIATYVVAAYCYALIKPIWCDEIWAVVPALNLVQYGFLGMGDVGMATPMGSPTAGNIWHMYWYPPLSYLSMAGWFKAFGYSLVTARMHSIVWGCVLLAGVYRLARRGYGHDWYWTGVWAALICALDYNFLLSSDARPEMMCAALGVWAIATRNAWFAAGAMLVHPFGVMYPIVLAILKRKIEWIPYVVVLGAWGIYIMQDPALWWSTTVTLVMVHFGQVEHSPGTGVYIAFGEGWRLLLLATYVACAGYIALRYRQIAIILGLIVLPAFFLTRTAYYFPHALPWLALCVAVVGRRHPWLLVTTLMLECAFAVTSLFPLWLWDGCFNLR